MSLKGNDIDELPLNSYNRIARIYDFLGDVVFLGALTRAQKAHLSVIPADATILIIGGGTGRILSHLEHSCSPRKVIFVDASSEMISQARKRVSPQFPVEFIHGRIGQLPHGDDFDVIICNFFLDQFSEDDVALILGRMQLKLKERGLLIVSDFIADAAWKRLFIRLMYVVFAAMGAVRVIRFPAWQRIVPKDTLREIAMSSFYSGFIRSACYRLSIQKKDGGTGSPNP